MSDIKDKTLSKALEDFEKLVVTKQGELDKIASDWQSAQENVQDLQEQEMDLQNEIELVNQYIEALKKIIGT